MTARAGPVDDTATGAVTSEAFRSVFRRHPSGVAVVALSDGGRPVGFTATSVISVSAEPPFLAFSVAGTSSSWPALSRADTLTVNFLAVDQVDLSARFATSGVDRFADVDWSRLAGDEPVLAEVSAWIRGRIIRRFPVGASYLVVVQAVESFQAEPTAPLVYHDRTYHQVDDRSAL